MMGFFSMFPDTALSLIFPRRCPLCGTLLRPNERVCGRCSDGIEYINPPVCRRCGRPIFECSCRDEVFDFERCVSPFVYTKSIRSGIHRMKFSNAPSSAKFFSLYMAATVRREYGGIPIDYVTCVPMHRTDLLRRGYNQAALLSEQVAEYLELPVNNKLLAKTQRNNIQHSLTKADRHKNVAGVYEAARPYLVSGKNILLCDDIITTGCTLNECARVLLAAGADRVLCVTAAAVVGSSQRNVKKIFVR